eukprot:8819406-Ditylum_brightwellii.AAC.1
MGDKNRTALSLMAALVQCLYQWRQGEPPEPPPGTFKSVLEAFYSQTKIRWDAVHKGFVSKKWKEDFWHHQNYFLKQLDTVAQLELHTKPQSHAIHHSNLTADDLPKYFQYLYQQPLKKDFLLPSSPVAHMSTNCSPLAVALLPA